MKKYILLAGVALATMTANNAMAGSYSDITVKAKIDVFEEVTCTDLNFGLIQILPSANLAAGAASTEAKVVLDSDGTVTTSGATVDSKDFGILSVTDAKAANWCGNNFGGGAAMMSGYPESVTLKNGDSTLTVSDFTENESLSCYVIGATLTIPDVMTVEAGEYTGSFTIYNHF